MKLYAAAVSIIIACLLIISGCFSSSSSNTGQSWLIIVGTDTAKVSDLGETWNSIDVHSRGIFTAGENPAGEYIEAYTRKMMLHRELESMDLLNSPEIISMGNSWLRMMTTEAALDYFISRAEASVTVSDLQFYKDHMGTSVWYTLNPGTDSSNFHGPDHLPELDFDLTILLDTLPLYKTGSTEDGVIVRLDSVYVTDSILVAETIADTVFCNNMAVNRITQGRNRRWMNGVRENLARDYSIIIDSSAVEKLSDYYSGIAELIDVTVITSDLGDWTSFQLRDEINELQTRMYAQPSSLTWQFFFIDNLNMNAFLTDTLQRAAPWMLDSLRTEAEVYTNGLALEKLYDIRISSAVTVNESEIESLYVNLEEPFMMDEMRSLQIVTIPDDSLEEYRTAVTENRMNEFISGLKGFVRLAADSSKPQITEPLAITEVPGGHGEEVFRIDPSDTTGWLGPLDLADGQGKVLFRLIEVVPEREANLQEARPTLEAMIRVRLEEEATNEWMRNLKLQYEPSVNEEVLNELPADPGLWETL